MPPVGWLTEHDLWRCLPVQLLDHFGKGWVVPPRSARGEREEERVSEREEERVSERVCVCVREREREREGEREGERERERASGGMVRSPITKLALGTCSPPSCQDEFGQCWDMLPAEWVACGREDIPPTKRTTGTWQTGPAVPDRDRWLVPSVPAPGASARQCGAVGSSRSGCGYMRGGCLWAFMSSPRCTAPL